MIVLGRSKIMKHTYSIKDIIKITGVTKRTLHYYDEINLLTPQKDPINHYRIYTQDDLTKLQTILLLKNLGISLKQIQSLLLLPEDALRNELTRYTTHLQNQIDKLITTKAHLHDFLAGKPLHQLELEHLPLSKQYETEAAIRYADTHAYQTYTAAQQHTSFDYGKAMQQLNQVFTDFNRYYYRGVSPEKSSTIVAQWKATLQNFADFDNSTLIGIANNYIEDARFQSYFDQFKNDDLPRYIVACVKAQLT